MNNAPKIALIAVAVAFTLAASAHAQSYSHTTHVHRDRQTVHRDFSTGPLYNYDSDGGAGDTAAALDE